MTKRTNDTIPAPGVDLQIGLLLAVLDQTTATWRRQLDDVSDDVVVWQPFPGAPSIGLLIMHLVDAEAFWIKEVGDGRPLTPEELTAMLSKETDQNSVQWPVPPRHPLSWYLAHHDAVRAQTYEIASRINDPHHLGDRADLPDREFTLRWLLSHIIQHDAYHGGQAVMLSLMRDRLPLQTAYDDEAEE